MQARVRCANDPCQIPGRQPAQEPGSSRAKGGVTAWKSSEGTATQRVRPVFATIPETRHRPRLADVAPGKRLELADSHPNSLSAGPCRVRLHATMVEHHGQDAHCLAD